MQCRYSLQDAAHVRVHLVNEERDKISWRISGDQVASELEQNLPRRIPLSLGHRFSLSSGRTAIVPFARLSFLPLASYGLLPLHLEGVLGEELAGSQVADRGVDSDRPTVESSRVWRVFAGKLLPDHLHDWVGLLCGDALLFGAFWFWGLPGLHLQHLTLRLLRFQLVSA